MMEIMRIAGITLFAAGFILAVTSFLRAKGSGTFEEIKELRKIRETGYTKEHKEERREDVYRKDPIAAQSRLMSRRAQRVLERMSKEEGSGAKPQGVAKGTSLLEEVAPPVISHGHALSVEQTETLAAAEEQTGALMTGKDQTAPLTKESTGVLPDKMIDEEGTAVLRRQTSEDTDVLPSKEESTDILTISGEETEPLISSDEDTAVLGGRLSDEEGTDILDIGEDTDMLERS